MPSNWENRNQNHHFLAAAANSPQALTRIRPSLKFFVDLRASVVLTSACPSSQKPVEWIRVGDRADLNYSAAVVGDGDVFH